MGMDVSQYNFIRPLFAELDQHKSVFAEMGSIWSALGNIADGGWPAGQ